jgi:hypothetical protein
MCKSIPVLAAIASMVAGVSIAVSANAEAPTSDAAYCHARVDAYKVNGDQRGRWESDLDVAVATAQCDQGNPGPAIPVLEQKLREARIDIPKRN